MMGVDRMQNFMTRLLGGVLEAVQAIEPHDAHRQARQQHGRRNQRTGQHLREGDGGTR